jgi:ribose transport system permease protein
VIRIRGWNPTLVLGQFGGVALIYLLFFLCGVPDTLFSTDNTKLILVQTVIVGVGALGMTLVIISAGIDLSVGSVIALASVTSALVFNQSASVALSVLAGIGTGAMVGFLNGVMIVGLRIVPFIATLGTLGIARGAAKILADEQTVNPPGARDIWLADILSIQWQTPLWLLPNGVWIMLLLALAVGFLLRFTVLGRYIYAIGSNEATARLCGVPVGTSKVGIYAICGALTGVSGVLMFGQMTIGDPTVAVGKELDIIAATVIGGGSLSGGEGSVLGSLIGAFIMSLLRNGCVKMGWPNPVQEIVIGAIIVLAVTIDQIRHRRAAE